MLVETWADEGYVYHVLRFGFEDKAADIRTGLTALPEGALVWETLAYKGETVEIIFRTATVIASLVA